MEKEMRLFWKHYLLLLLIKFPQGPSWCFETNILVQSFFCQGRIACANVLSDLYAMGVVDCHNMLMLLGGELRLANYNLQDEHNCSDDLRRKNDNERWQYTNDDLMMSAVQLPLIFQPYAPLFSLEGDDGPRTGRCDPPHDAGAVHKDVNANGLKKKRIISPFFSILNPKNLNLVIARTCTKYTW